MAQPTPNAGSLPIVACPVSPGGAAPGQSGTPKWAAMRAACDGGLLAVKLWTGLGALDAPLATSIAVALQKRVPVVGKSDVGMNPVSLMPSELKPVIRIDAKLAAVLISNLYV